MIVSKDPHIEVNLPNGMYVFDNLSGTGKTYLYQIVRQLSSMPELRVTACRNVEEFNSMAADTAKLVVVDRYDLWGDDSMSERLASISENAVVLVDAKTFLTGAVERSDLCTIHVDDGRMVIDDSGN